MIQKIKVSKYSFLVLNSVTFWIKLSLIDWKIYTLLNYIVWNEYVIKFWSMLEDDNWKVYEQDCRSLIMTCIFALFTHLPIVPEKTK